MPSSEGAPSASSSPRSGRGSGRRSPSRSRRRGSPSSRSGRRASPGRRSRRRPPSRPSRWRRSLRRRLSSSGPSSAPGAPSRRRSSPRRSFRSPLSRSSRPRVTDAGATRSSSSSPRCRGSASSRSFSASPLGGRDPGPWLAARFDEKVPEILAFYRTSGWEESAVEAAGRIFHMMASAFSEQLPGLVLAAAVLFGGVVVYSLRPALGGRVPRPRGAVVRALPDPPRRRRGLHPGRSRRGPRGGSRPPGGRGRDPSPRRLVFSAGPRHNPRSSRPGRAGLFLRALVWVVVFQMPLPLVLALGGILDEFLDVRGRVERWAAARRDGPPAA